MMHQGKRLLALLLALVMVISMIPAAAAKGFEKSRQWASNQFSDVPEYQWYYDTVKEAYELGLMSGDPDGSFRPDGSVTLAETVAVASRIHAIHHLGEEKFVQGEVWYEIYVDYALQNGILEAALSEYNRPATRLEFARILSKALPEKELKKINEVEDGAIPDVKDDEAVYLLYRAGVLTGNDDQGTFAPKSNIKRSEVAAIVARMALPELRKEITLKAGGASVGNISDFTPSEKVDPEDYIDENNALTQPFDLVYPEVFESGAVEYSGEQILIKLAKDSGLSAALKAAGVTAMEKIMEISSGVWYKAYVDGDVKTVMEAVRQIKDVLVAEYDYAYETEAITDSTEVDSDVHGNKDYADQWYLCSCGIQKGWGHLKHHHHHGPKPDDTDQGDENVGIAGEGVVVAVIDTGVDYNHEDLKDSMWINTEEIPDNNIDDDKNGYVDDYYGYNAVAGKGSADDDNGHGTHVAGIIAAADNNLGIVGIAYNAKIMAVKAGMASGFFNNSDIAEAIIYAHDNGADVINMSFGGSATTIAVTDALEYAYTNCVLVASAGNDGKKNEPTSPYDFDYIPNYPAALSYVLGVMSVDQNGVESSFTNWDVNAFNSVEYEVYAPGEAMLSTIPGNQYAKWNGTSMAAPVVSAIAALLRAEFYDRTMYPTKFIYGQISGTGTQKAICIDPESHGETHVKGMPKIVDLYQAMTVLPKPEVGVSDYVIFDTPGLQGNEKNNGDGVIDAGETIAIGFTLRNRWGKTGNTVVSVDTMSHGISDPYVTPLNNDVSYGSVGTYSTQDAGRIEENGVFTGWMNPIYLQISADCPNDYIIKLNVTTQSTNGLDTEDETVYQSMPVSFNLDVRRGTILPNKIEEDMTLTAEDLYIIDNTTTIFAGATVTVQPGARIQFWADDEEGAYAQKNLVSLKVEGTLLFEGTEKDPIEVYPSERFGDYQVEIYESGSGLIKMRHTNVMNPVLNISYAENCEFSQNYRNMRLRYRYLSGGTVYTSSTAPKINLIAADSCAYYKLGPAALSTGRHDGCIFVDSAMDFQGLYEDCVFYGNNNYLGEEEGAKSTLTVPSASELLDFDNTTYPVRIVQNEDDATTYIAVYSSAVGMKSISVVRNFAKWLGGGLACIETEDEMEFISQNFREKHKIYGFAVDICQDQATNGWIWGNGEALGDFFPVTPASEDPDWALLTSSSHSTYGYQWRIQPNSWTSSSQYYLFEIPGIAVEDTSISLSTADVGYQVKLSTELKGLRYRSADETVAVVDETGFVTPVGVGETEITISSDVVPSNAVIKVSVYQYIAMSGVDLGDDLDMIKGETYQLIPVITPIDHTETLIYSSSDDSVATVNNSGIVEAVGPGETIITAVCESNDAVNDEIVVRVEVPLEAISAEPLYVTKTNTEETVDVLGVELTPNDTTVNQLIWESSNPEIVYVDDDGNLVKSGNEGSALLRATVAETQLYTEITVIVSDASADVTVTQLEYLNAGNRGYYRFALLSDGTLWYWGTGVSTPKRIIVDEKENIKRFAIGYSLLNTWLVLVDENQTLYAYTCSHTSFDWDSPRFGPVSDVVDVASNSQSNGQDFFMYLLQDGSVWSWGYNAGGQLGIGNKDNQSKPVQVSTAARIADIEVDRSGYSNNVGTGVLLDWDGNVYLTRGGPTLYATDVLSIKSVDGYIRLEYEEEVQFRLDGDKIKKLGDQMFRYGTNTDSDWYIENEIVYGKGNNYYGQLGVGHTSTVEEYVPMEKVSNVANMFIIGATAYIQTKDGKFYGVGNNNNSSYGIPNLSEGNQALPSRIYFGLDEVIGSPVLEGTNIHSDVVYDSWLELDFNQGLKEGSAATLIKLIDSSGTQLSVEKVLKLDKLRIGTFAGFVEGETYTLTIPANAYQNTLNVSVPEMEFTFTYENKAEEIEQGEANDSSVMALSLFAETAEEDVASEQFIWTVEEFEKYWETYLDEGTSSYFRNNAVLNRTDREDQVETHWLRIVGASASTYSEHPLSRNYWGTVSSEMIDHQISDFDDYNTLVDIHEGDFLTTAPENVWPFAVKAGLLDKDGNEVEVVGNETLTFYVDFNRDMDTSIELDVRFGSAYPYADYAVEGQWVNARRWEGTTTLNTLIEGGYQYWSIDNGRAADAPLKLYKDWGRFQFEIDTTSAQAMVLQGQATDEGVQLTWFQDDFDTLAGYNVYRTQGSEDGQYTRLNPTIIPATVKTFLDDNVEPGEVYFYNFTVVKTDLSESTPSGRTRVLSKDTIPPSLIHTPVNVGTVGKNLTISATVTDNLRLDRVTLYYRTTGTAEWKSVDMASLNDKYSAIVAGNVLDTAGLEYYIEAFDGVGCAYKGTADAPYTVIIREKTDSDAKGDFDGDGKIDILDAYKILQAASGKLNADADQFKRADLDGDGKLTAAEALTVLKYVNGEIGSLQIQQS